MTQDLTVKPQTQPVFESSRIFDRSSPKEIMLYAKDAANALMEVLKMKKNPVIFRNEQYMEFEDWQTVGRFFGLSCQTGDAEPILIDNIKGAKAKARIVVTKTQEIVGSADAYCMRDEDNWKAKPWFQIASMAQTRAGAKAFRNILSWVPVFAGVSSKLLEEISPEPAVVGPQVVQNPRMPITPEQKNSIIALCKKHAVPMQSLAAHLKGIWKIDSMHEIKQSEFLPICDWISRQATGH